MPLFALIGLAIVQANVDHFTVPSWCWYILIVLTVIDVAGAIARGLRDTDAKK